MTNEEEAIKQLERISKCISAIGENVDYTDFAIEALKKQVPKLVAYEVTSYWSVKEKSPKCPVCDYFLTPVEFIGDAEKVTYCDHCGQKLLWC